jgi:DNA-binding NarL/FixJ family response regulator
VNIREVAVIDMAAVRVLLVDDNIIYLRAVSAMLANKPEVELVGCAISGEEAIELTELLQPDVVLLDLSMPGIGGIEATRRIKSGSPSPRVAIVTASCGSEYREAAEAAGADDFICKDRLTTELRRLFNQMRSNYGHEA